MDREDPIENTIETRLRSQFGRGPDAKRYEDVISRVFASREDAAFYLTHNDFTYRLISALSISEKWGLDELVVDRILEAIPSTLHPDVQWQLCFLLGRNEDKGQAVRIIRCLLRMLNDEGTGPYAMDAVYLSIIFQAQRLGIYHTSTTEYIRLWSTHRGGGGSTDLFNDQFLSKVQQMIYRLEE
jgi:hypothetical protein